MHSRAFAADEAFKPPENAIGADLLWWRAAGGMRTLVTVFWDPVQAFDDPVHLEAVLFESDGLPIAGWRAELEADRPLFIDSAAAGPWALGQGIDGVLALYVCTESKPSAAACRHYNRLFPLLDWQLPDGRIATLHSDQNTHRGSERTQRFTEIVVEESDRGRNALVLLNGEEAQAADALKISARNSHGEELAARYALPMRPFTVHRIELARLLPGLADFAEGQPVLVSGSFASRGLFTRPYVETSGPQWGGYHAGNVYRWPELPYAAHALIGGEVDPIAVVHDGQTRTFVNLLNSHDSLAADFVVDALLYADDGSLIASRPAWLIAARDGLARADIAELLPDPGGAFRGHLALRFATVPGQPVPRHLQALMEYQRQSSLARVMTWSDEWNSRVRLARRDRSVSPAVYRSWFRAWHSPGVATQVAVVNAGPSGYARAAEVRAQLFRESGVVAEVRFSIAPLATRWATIEELFPNVDELLSKSGFAILLLESSSDLANLAFTHDLTSGAMSAEHFISLKTDHLGEIQMPMGS